MSTQLTFAVVQPRFGGGDALSQIDDLGWTPMFNLPLSPPERILRRAEQVKQ
jgi:hypothetical protein